MWLRPWHVIVCVVALAVVLIACAYSAGDRVKDLLLGVGVNLLSSVVFFLLLEAYWQQMKRSNGKEVDGFDYLRFARNVRRSKQVRVLSTYVYPLTHHPGHAAEREALLGALDDLVAKPSFLGVQIILLHPGSPAARTRAEERKDDDVLLRLRESLDTLHGLLKLLDGRPSRGRVEVRLTSRMPPFSLFQTDNFASISFFYRDRPVSEVTRYQFFVDSPLGEFVEKTFDDLWRDGNAVPLEEYLRSAGNP